MKELHALVDFENVQPSLEALAKLAPGFNDVWLFHGPHQTKQAQALAASHARVTLVPHSGKGKNALKPMLDKDSTSADAEAMVQKLQDKGVVKVQGTLVTYLK